MGPGIHNLVIDDLFVVVMWSRLRVSDTP